VKIPPAFFTIGIIAELFGVLFLAAEWNAAAVIAFLIGGISLIVFILDDTGRV
jgi:hypothetical protein